MAKRLLVLVALLLILPATALAATVHVRIEGKTKNLFAPQEATVTAGNALEALQQASLAGEFYYHITQSSFGNYVDQVGFYGGTADSGWVFKVNDVSPPVGCRPGDVEGRRSCPLVLRHLRADGRPADARGEGLRQGLLHGDSVRRHRESRCGHRSRVACRLAEVPPGLDGEVAVPRGAPRCARSRDGDRRHPFERGEVRLAAVLALTLALAGCGGGGREHGTATLWVTRDRGGQVIFAGGVPAGLDGIQAVERKLKVSTRYGGRFLQSIDGISGSLTGQRDWFFFVNGIEGGPERDRGDAPSR